MDNYLCIFRLTPQEYHRFQSPVDGKIGKMTYISGEYNAVNVSAARSFGTNEEGDLPTSIYGLETSELPSMCPAKTRERSFQLTVHNSGGSLCVLGQ